MSAPSRRPASAPPGRGAAARRAALVDARGDGGVRRRLSLAAPRSYAARPGGASRGGGFHSCTPAAAALRRAGAATGRACEPPDGAPRRAPSPGAADAQPPPPESGLLLVNTTDELSVAWVDGFVAAWVAPGGRALLPEPGAGATRCSGRTFLGDAWEAPETVPPRHERRGGDARAPDRAGAARVGQRSCRAAARDRRAERAHVEQRVARAVVLEDVARVGRWSEGPRLEALPAEQGHELAVVAAHDHVPARGPDR